MTDWIIDWGQVLQGGGAIGIIATLLYAAARKVRADNAQQRREQERERVRLNTVCRTNCGRAVSRYAPRSKAVIDQGYGFVIVDDVDGGLCLCEVCRHAADRELQHAQSLKQVRVYTAWVEGGRELDAEQRAILEKITLHAPVLPAATAEALTPPTDFPVLQLETKT